MNTANKLTMCRVVMIPIFIVLLYLNFTGHLVAALVIFILASITDFVDGYVARHYNQVTDFGKFMDPLADKLLVLSAMAWFVEVNAERSERFCTPTISCYFALISSTSTRCLTLKIMPRTHGLST